MVTEFMGTRRNIKTNGWRKPNNQSPNNRSINESTSSQVETSNKKTHRQKTHKHRWQTKKTIKQVTRHTIVNSTIRKYSTGKQIRQRKQPSVTKQHNVNFTIHSQ